MLFVILKFAVRDLRGDDSGKYEIQIENEVGNDAARASLTVYGPPEPPANRPFVSLIDAENSSLTLAWYGSAFDGGSILTGYIVEMSSWAITSSTDPPDASDWQVLNDETLLSTSFVVKGLKKDKEYIFRVKAVNSQGHSEPSKVSEPVSLASHQHSGASEEEENANVHTRCIFFEHCAIHCIEKAEKRYINNYQNIYLSNPAVTSAKECKQKVRN